MSQRTIIGLVGFPRSGKDYAASRMIDTHGFTRIAFGDGVKKLLLAIDPSYRDNLDVLEASKANGDDHTREKLQNLGQTLRDFDEDFWVKTAVEHIKALPEGVPVVITDIRYPNEFHLVKDMGGTVVGIERPGYGPVNDHVSETNTATILEHADVIVKNDRTIDELVQDILSTTSTTH